MTIATAPSRASILADQVNNPFVAHVNVGAGATLAGTSTVAGGGASNAVNGNTYSYWIPDVTSSSANLRFTFGTARTVSFAAIEAHNLADYDATISVQRSTDGGTTWVDAGAGAVTPTDNRAIAWRMVAIGNDAANWRFQITGLTSGDDIAIGVAFLGDEIVIPRRLYQGFAPILTPTEVGLQSNVSVGGHLLGSSVVQQGSTLQADISNIDPAFLRGATWLDFQRAFNRGAPAFFAWRPTKYGTDLHYIWRDGQEIRPVNSGPRDLMSLQIAARAYEASE